MSICTPCTQTKPILYCSTAVYVGDWIAGVGVTVQVYWRNTATDRTKVEEVVTGVDGKVSITFDGRMESSSYELWMNTSLGKMNAKPLFYLPGTTTEVSCITVNFDRAFDSDPVTVAESVIEAN
jgi:hypothetical protein